MSFIPSKYQEAIFDFIQHGTGHGVVEAVAGSGKTKTIELGLNYIPRDKTVCFVAFNKHIAEELKRRAPSNVRAMTLHSMGFQAILNSSLYPQGFRPELDNGKVYGILDALFQTEFMQLSQEQVDDIRVTIKKLVSLLKATLCPVNKESIIYLMERYGIDNEVEDLDLLTSITTRTMNLCKTQINTIDFDDQIWYPIVYNMQCWQYDFVFIDECQDFNKSQIELALKAVKSGGRIVAVGDRYQSLYGFRGADVEAVPRMIERLSAKTFPLSTTYRCPKSHVKLAKRFVPDIEAAEWAEEGEITEISQDKLTEHVKPNDMIICRYNAPLVRPAFKLIRAGFKVVIRGRDIGEGLLTLIRKLKVNSMQEFLNKLDKWMRREKAKLIATGKCPEPVVDKYDCLMALTEDCDTLQQLTTKIKTIFSDDNAAVTFSSIHRAKGLESERVFILFPELMPSQYAVRDWEIQQEWNCQYVAYTRSKKSLFLVH